MNDQDDLSSFARSNVGGKKSSRVESRVSDELKIDLARKCHEIGMTESEYIEQLLGMALYGVEHVLSVQRQRAMLVCGLSGLAGGDTRREPVRAVSQFHGRG